MSRNPSKENFDGLAPRLLSPPTPPASLQPPARPPLHELPLGELSWEDFERLAWRLVALQGEVRQTTLYGTPGQKQVCWFSVNRSGGVDRGTEVVW